MTGSRQPRLTEELLSAYLDDEVTAEERALVEAAIAADPAIAWQVESLRQTVHLLHALPPLALPRSFTLEVVMADRQAPKVVTAPQAAPVQPHVVSPRSRARPTIDEHQRHWWQWLLQIWQGGNLQLRNAAAVAFTLLVVLVLSDRLVAPTHLRQPIALPVPTAKVVATNDSEVTTSAAIVMTTAPIETATNLAQIAPATPLAADANGVTEAPAPSAKAAPDQGSPVTDLSTEKRLSPQPGGASEDTFDMSGSHSGSFGDQPGGSMSSVMTDDSRAMATSSDPAALTQAAPNGAANQVRPASSPATTATSTVTAILTVTPTITVTATASISAAGQTAAITNTEVLTAFPATFNGARPTPPTATESWLAWAEMMAGVCTAVLGGLWWRSRGGVHA